MSPWLSPPNVAEPSDGTVPEVDDLWAARELSDPCSALPGLGSAAAVNAASSGILSGRLSCSTPRSVIEFVSPLLARSDASAPGVLPLSSGPGAIVTGGAKHAPDCCLGSSAHGDSATTAAVSGGLHLASMECLEPSEAAVLARLSLVLEQSPRGSPLKSTASPKAMPRGCCRQLSEVLGFVASAACHGVP